MDKLKQVLANPILVKYNFIILPVVSVIISILLLIFVVFAQINNSLKNQDDISTLNQKTDKLNQKNSALQAVDDSSYQDYVQTSLLALPADKDIPGVIGQLNIVLRNNNLNLDNLGFGNATSQNGIQSFQIRLEVQGSSTDIKNMINQLKSTPRLLRVNALEINSSRNNSKSSAQMDILAFYKELPTSIGGVEDTLAKPSMEDLRMLANLKLSVQQIPAANTQNATGAKGKTDPFQ